MASGVALQQFSASDQKYLHLFIHQWNTALSPLSIKEAELNHYKTPCSMIPCLLIIHSSLQSQRILFVHLYSVSSQALSHTRKVFAFVSVTYTDCTPAQAHANRHSLPRTNCKKKGMNGGVVLAVGWQNTAAQASCCVMAGKGWCCDRLRRCCCCSSTISKSITGRERKHISHPSGLYVKGFDLNTLEKKYSSSGS